jgi:hypothetical protein
MAASVFAALCFVSIRMGIYQRSGYIVARLTA